MTEKNGTKKNGNGLKIPKTLAFEKHFDFYEDHWKEGIITKKISRAEYKEILDKARSICLQDMWERVRKEDRYWI